jgi:glutamate formiminotransferase
LVAFWKCSSTGTVGDTRPGVKIEPEIWQNEAVSTEVNIHGVETRIDEGPRSCAQNENAGLKLRSNASIYEIADALRAPNSGLSFVKCNTAIRIELNIKYYISINIITFNSFKYVLNTQI